MNKHKKLTQIVFVTLGLIILVGAIGATIVLANKRHDLKDEVPVVSNGAVSEKNKQENISGETSTWKTFSDSRLGFKLDYPSNWSANPDRRSFGPFDPKDTVKGGVVTFSPSKNQAGSNLGGEVRFGNNASNFTLDYVYKESKKVPNYSNFEMFTIDGEPAFKYKVNSSNQVKPVITAMAITIHKGRLYIFMSELVTIPRILSSFKFLK